MKNNDTTNFETKCAKCGGKAIGCGDTVTCERCDMLKACPEAGRLFIYDDDGNIVKSRDIPFKEANAIAAKLISQAEEIKELKDISEAEAVRLAEENKELKDVLEAEGYRFPEREFP